VIQVIQEYYQWCDETLGSIVLRDFNHKVINLL